MDCNTVFPSCLLPALTLRRSSLPLPEGFAIALSGGWRPLETSNVFPKVLLFSITVRAIMLLQSGLIFQIKLRAIPTKLCSFSGLCIGGGLG